MGTVSNPIPVTADDRERGSRALELLRENPDFQVTVSRLKLGDYLVDGRLLFERKTWTDLAAAIVSDRLFSQAARLAATSLRPGLIIEGDEREIARTGLHREAIQGA